MAGKFLELTFTDSVRKAQQHYYGRAHTLPPQPDRDPLAGEEIQFIQSRDSFYMATVTESGWPYVQHHPALHRRRGRRGRRALAPPHRRT